ncbi:AMP-binding protein [Nocardioides sp. W3-2-3]|uniref:AMP-binding protein n=1 Tax=Nocardioides convexus TaxID=2712224 RepID=UPI00241823D9|nr:AMP-binding protein [Nocardioides convexus]NHA00733.1 AMP-binding protein [Nocardioides convexus]
MYGQTEATARMAYLPPHLAARHPETVGHAIPGGSFRLEPVAGAAPGVGELVYSGPNVMMGYAESPADLRRGAETRRAPHR